MFRIACMVDDKRLAETLRALAALGAYDVEPTPVANATKEKGKVVSQGSTCDMFLASLKDRKVATFTTGDLKSFLRDIGKASSSATYVISQLTSAKRIKMISRSNYEVKK